MWGGRFRKAEERSALDFNASVSYDCRMYKEDIAGSLAHASMLADRGIISKEDLEKITGGLLQEAGMTSAPQISICICAGISRSWRRS